MIVQVWENHQLLRQASNYIGFFLCLSQQEFQENELEPWQEMFNIVC